MRRTYMLAADPIVRKGMEPNREILELAEGTCSKVILVVPNAYALDVLRVIRRAYQDGREDNAPHFHGSGRGEPCWCPSPLTYAPQGSSEYGSEETA